MKIKKALIREEEKIKRANNMVQKAGAREQKARIGAERVEITRVRLAKKD